MTDWVQLAGVIAVASFSWAMLSYPEVAAQRRWPSGTAVEYVALSGFALCILALAASLFLFRWWYVFVVLAAGFFVGSSIQLWFRQYTQMLAPIGLIGAIAFLTAAYFGR